MEAVLGRSGMRASRRPVIVAGGLTALAAVVFAVALSRGGGKPAAIPASPPTSASWPRSSGAATGAVLRIDPVTNKVAADAYAVGRDPTAVAVGGPSSFCCLHF